MGDGRTDEPRDEPQANQRLTVAQAAAALDITEGAVRSRIKRGTLPTVKEGGTVYIMLGGTSAANHPPHADETSVQSELVEELRDRVRYLERQVEEERDARRRADTLLARLMDRVPELEARESSEPAEPRSTTEGQQEPTSRPEEERRSWWRRWFGDA